MHFICESVVNAGKSMVKPRSGDKPLISGDKHKISGDKPKLSGDKHKINGDKPRKVGDNPPLRQHNYAFFFAVARFLVAGFFFLVLSRDACNAAIKSVVFEGEIGCFS